jgi:BirA family biotin operon repressor/biotin-[acetyl-CoA-carboxylase] ligase
MPEASAKDIDQRWTDVDSLLGFHINRSQLLALVLNNIVPLLDSFEQRGFNSYRQRWQQLDSFFGQSVQLEWGEQRVIGRAQGVDDSGAYCVMTEQGQRRFSGGEVSLRAFDGGKVA